LEKLKLAEISTREAVFEAARMYVPLIQYTYEILMRSRIHLVHEDSKEKDFELEMSWIGDETNGLFAPVPKDLFNEADSKARAALEDFE
jgi:20S proteasome subunit alpha 7